jgi:hypothetical protein
MDAAVTEVPKKIFSGFGTQRLLGERADLRDGRKALLQKEGHGTASYEKKN